MFLGHPDTDLEIYVMKDSHDSPSKSERWPSWVSSHCYKVNPI